MRSVRFTGNHDLPALLGLFQRAFGSPLLDARWHWKYAHAPCWGTAVERGGEVIAFFGGMPRQFAHERCRVAHMLDNLHRGHNIKLAQPLLCDLPGAIVDR